MKHLLENISWTTFLSSLSAILVLYYSYIAYTLYDQEIQALFRAKPKPGHNAFHFQESEPVSQQADPRVKTEAPEVPFEETNENTFERIEALILELKPAIKSASIGPMDKAAMSHSLSQILNTYPDLKDSPFKPALNELILTECSNTGLDTLSEDDLQQLWDGVS